MKIIFLEIFKLPQRVICDIIKSLNYPDGLFQDGETNVYFFLMFTWRDKIKHSVVEMYKNICVEKSALYFILNVFLF